MNKTKVKIGLLHPLFTPIETEPDGAAPVYQDSTKELSLGHAVSATLTLTTSDLKVPGDDVMQISATQFISGSLATETLLNSLELDAALFGSTTGEDGTVTDSADDASPAGAVSYIQKLMKKDKKIFFRAVVLFRCEADRASYTDEASTKGETIEVKNHPVTFNVFTANNNEWRWRKDFDTEAAALEAIKALLHPTKTASISAGSQKTEK